MKRLIILVTLIVLSTAAYSQATENDTIIALGKDDPASDDMQTWSIKMNADIKRGLDPSADSVAYADSSDHANKSDTAIWALGSTAGGGDMFISTYDPTAVSGDAFDMDNMVEGTNLILSATERSNISTNNAKISYTDGALIDQSVVSGSTPTFTNTNFTEATDKNYVSDAQLVVIGNTSGSNTGDQDLSGKQDNITLTTTGSSGASTLIGATLNIPQYSGGGGDVSMTDTILLIGTKADIADLQAQLDDTATFYLQAIFGLGSGQIADTAAFAADAYCGSFRNWTGDTITIDSINAVMLGTTPDVDIQFFISTSISDGSADELRTTDFNITSTTIGDTFSSFDGTVDVLPEQRIWCKVTAVATEPTYLEITVSYTPK